MKIAYIRWLDAWTEEAQTPHTSVKPGLAELHEVGFLLSEDSEKVVIGLEMCGDDTEPGRFRLHIPKGQIQEMKIMDVETFKKGRKRPGSVK